MFTCRKLTHDEEGPVERMADDLYRVHMASTARKGDATGVRGSQDGWVQAAARKERAARKPSAACRSCAHGCAACRPSGAYAQHDAAICKTCDGWREWSTRAGRARELPRERQFLVPVFPGGRQ